MLPGLLGLTSCVLGRAKSAKTPAAPAPPPAAATVHPAASPGPLSSPQTEIQLPPPQPIPPEALATLQAPPEPPAPEPPPAVKPPAPKKPVASAPKPEAPAPAETAPPVAPPATPPAEEQPRLQPVYPEEERRRILGEMEKRKAEIEGLLRGLNPNRLSADQKTVVERVRSFLNVAEDQAKRGDFRSAEALSERALILARELASGR